MTAAVAIGSAAAAAPGWTQQPTVNPATRPGDWNDFNAVTRPAIDDGWAAGYVIRYPKPYRDQILVEHWNGRRWAVSPTPPTAGPDTEIVGLSSSDPDDVWAVGTTGDLDNDTSKTLAMHWNGTAWRLSRTPAFPLDEDGVLQAVASHGAQDVWACGSVDGRGLLEHWNGHAWRQVSGAQGAGDLGSVSVAGDGSIWAVGAGFDPRTGATTTFAEHRVAGSWVRTETPNPLDTQGEDANELYGVAAISKSDAWAVGITGDEDANIPYTPLVLHWNGTSWHRVEVPSPDAGGDPLFGVVARGPKDVWAVGYGSPKFGGLRQIGIVEHWNGDAWTARRIAPGGALASIAVNPADGELWAAGFVETPDHADTLLEAHP